jgi:hypothetical protein
MTTQPEALRLADVLGRGRYYERRAAAELRRLHGIEFALRDCEKTLEGMAKKYMDAADQRNELLHALKALIDEQEGPPLIRRHRQWQAAVDACRAAIAKAEGQA